MKHQPDIHQADELASLLRGTDNITDSLEWIGAGELLNDDMELIADPKSWWVVKWPDHVVLPRYNGDCNVHGPFDSREEAEEYAA